jgi:hypothetical protein
MLRDQQEYEEANSKNIFSQAMGHACLIKDTKNPPE